MAIKVNKTPSVERRGPLPKFNQPTEHSKRTPNKMCPPRDEGRATLGGAWGGWGTEESGCTRVEAYLRTKFPEEVNKSAMKKTCSV